jgi:hypothetical protein
VCTGTVSKHLTITGGSRNDVEPTLNGNGAGPVLTIGSGVTVTVTGLTVTRRLRQ